MSEEQATPESAETAVTPIGAPGPSAETPPNLDVILDSICP